MMRLLPLLALTLFACKDDGSTPEDTNIGGTDSGPSEVIDNDGDGVPAEEDCDDDDAAVNPAAAEICDGVDNNCDGEVDGANAEGATSWYPDTDGDGYGVEEGAVIDCEAPPGFVAEAQDCVPDDAAFYPGAPETDCLDPNDYNCDGSVGFADGDGDGFAACEECDDGSAAVNPDATEVCDGVDNNCDAVTDGADAADASTWYQDADTDGYGDLDFSTLACEQPAGYAADSTDCDDAQATVNPGATELCNLVDDDCDTLIDEDAADASVWYDDGDGDGYGDPDASLSACEQPSGAVADNTDCDYADGDVSPADAEICDGLDNNCDGSVDEGAADDAATWYNDSDGDGYGDAGSSVSACEAPTGYVSDATDCDDGEGAVNPGEDEVCDGVDNDCDGLTDDSSATDAKTYYSDADGDSYGNASSVLKACSKPTGAVGNKKDCDDGDSAVSPAASEVCDGIDNNCDGLTDDGSAIDATSYYLDGDCDGFGDASALTPSCTSLGDDYTTDSSDCDDADARSFPSATEVCEGADNDCDGSADNSCSTAIEISAPSHDPVNSPAEASACARLGELTTSMNPHDYTNLPSYMKILEGSSTGLASASDFAADYVDFSIRCGSNYSVAPGNYTASTIPWPTLPSTSSGGAGRIRGYINIGCGDELNYTFGLIGNDSVALYIEGQEIMKNNWSDGQWKKFRYVSFPGPGLYAVEVQWSTNLSCEIDPLEVVWSPGFVAGYDNYDTMCASSSCLYGTGVVIPGFTILDFNNLVQSSDGSATSCDQCSTSADCASGETCNSAGICE